MLAVRRFGSGPPVVALHGFTFTGNQFAHAADQLDRTVIAPDLPGHGDSVNASTSPTDVVAAVTESIAAIGASLPLMGYSQGGRVALASALDSPDRVSALVLVSTTAGIESPTERRTRARADERLAASLRITPLDDFLDSWTSEGITSTMHLSADLRRTDRALRSDNTPSGLADALVGFGQGAQPPVWDQLEALTMPVLVVSGSRDPKYTDIGDRIATMVPSAERISIEGSGHNPFLDAADIVYPAISDFLDRRS